MTPDVPRTVLITGGDGYLGLRIARRYLSQTIDGVLLYVRSRDRHELAAKRRRVERLLGHYGARIRVAGGDLTVAAPFAAVDPRPIRVVIHAAAQARFNVSRQVAQAVNVDGTERVLTFAARCPRLERVALLSSVYACGLQPGRIDESEFAGAHGFANFYEWSKWRAEQLLLHRFAHLPWRLLRVATVIADDEHGGVTQYNAFHRTLQLCHHGLLSLLPGDPATPLYFVSGDFVADAVFALTESIGERAIYHLTHDGAAASTLGDLVRIAFAAFEADPAFRARRVLPPLFCDWQSFAALAAAVDGFSGPEVKRAIHSVLPFGRQLFSVKDVDNQNLVQRVPNALICDPRKLIAATCASLLRRWGRTALDISHGGGRGARMRPAVLPARSADVTGTAG